MTDFYFYRTDGSYDYLAPWGVSTLPEDDWHGFSMEVDENDDYDTKTISGFGELSYLDDFKNKPITELIAELDDLIINDLNSDDPQVTSVEVIEELMENLREQAIIKEAA